MPTSRRTLMTSLAAGAATLAIPAGVRPASVAAGTTPAPSLRRVQIETFVQGKPRDRAGRVRFQEQYQREALAAAYFLVHDWERGVSHESAYGFFDRQGQYEGVIRLTADGKPGTLSEMVPFVAQFVRTVRGMAGDYFFLWENPDRAPHWDQHHVCSFCL